jgi:hypothetical protein
LVWSWRSVQGWVVRWSPVPHGSPGWPVPGVGSEVTSLLAAVGIKRCGAALLQSGDERPRPHGNATWLALKAKRCRRRSALYKR